MAELARWEIAQKVRNEGAVVLVLVTRTGGSTPRDAGAAMIVGARRTTGTVGGGTVEHRAIGIARDMLAGRAPARAEVDFPLGPALDQCCGGRMSLALARLTEDDLDRIEADAPLALWDGGPALQLPARRRQVIVYGAGHVGRALIAVLARLPFRVLWIETYEGEMGPTVFPGTVETRLTPLPEAEAARADPDAFHIVLTHSHAIDLEIVEAVLRRGQFGYLGVIGSATKRATFVRRLSERGLPGEAIAGMACPIGLPGLRDKAPEVIAASVAADLLLRDRGEAAAGTGAGETGTAG